MFTRRTFLVSALVTPFLARGAMAAEPVVYSEAGVAIDGSDAVAYFDGNGPVAGDAAHSLMWQNTTWRFASAENMAKFEANPVGFAPQYGGYCAFAMAEGYVASTDPRAWSLVDGKLYLNYSRRVRTRWERDIPGNIIKADANWPQVLQG